VARYTTKLVESLPAELKDSLPSPEAIEAELESQGRKSSARQSRSNTETRQPGLVHSGVHKHVRWLDVFVDKTASARLAECCSEANSTTKKLFQFQWPSQKAIEWLADCILEQEHGPALVLCEGDRPNRPCWIELVLQRDAKPYSRIEVRELAGLIALSRQKGMLALLPKLGRLVGAISTRLSDGVSWRRPEQQESL
jgi:hypothetical protein